MQTREVEIKCSNLISLPFISMTPTIKLCFLDTILPFFCCTFFVISLGDEPIRIYHIKDVLKTEYMCASTIKKLQVLLSFQLCVCVHSININNKKNSIKAPLQLNHLLIQNYKHTGYVIVSARNHALTPSTLTS